MTAGGGMLRVAKAGAVAAWCGGQGRGAGLGDRVADHAGSIRIQGIRGIPVRGDIAREAPDGCFVPGRRMGACARGLGMAGRAGCRGGTAIELGGARGAVAALAVLQILLGLDAVVGGARRILPDGSERMGGADTAMAQRRVVATGLSACGRRRGRVPGWVVRRTREVAGGAHRRVGRVRRGVAPGGSAGGAPGSRGVRRAHAVAGGAGIGGGTAGEVGAVADLAGAQTTARGGVQGQLGAEAMDGGISEVRGGLVVAARGHAGGNAASHLDHGELMALGAVANACHRLGGMGGHPAAGVVVAVVLGRIASLAAAAREEQRGNQKEAKNSRQPCRALPIPNPVHEDTQGKQATRRRGTDGEKTERGDTKRGQGHRIVLEGAEGDQDIPVSQG